MIAPQPFSSSAFDKHDREFEHHSSMIPEESENLSPEPSDKHSAEAGSRMLENLISLIPVSSAQKKRQDREGQSSRKAGKDAKVSAMVQVPSTHELKVGSF